MIDIKTTLVGHNLKIQKQQTKMVNMDNRISRRLESIESRLEKREENASVVQQKEIEEKIKEAQGDLKKDIAGAHRESGIGSDSNTNRNLIIHGMDEHRRVEDVVKVQDVAQDIGLTLHRWDIDKTIRLGAYEDGKRRPVKAN